MARTSAVLVLVLGVFAWAWAPAPAEAKKKGKPPVPSAEKPADVKKGKTALLKAPEGMQYFLRVPKKYDPKKGAPLLVFMHGSNMNGMQYLPMFPAKRWYGHAIICAPNGETGNKPFGSNNFTQQSAPLVADVVKQVQGAFNITHTYIGGHSQGGYLTYSVIMHFPELFQGAIPMAGTCWSQNEPSVWDGKSDVVAKQQKVAIAIIHGKADPIVDFDGSQYSYDIYTVMGYSKLRLLAPEGLGHQFGLSPVGEALLWLDAMNGLNAKKGLKAAAKWAKNGEWGWVYAAGSAYRDNENTSGSDKAKAGKLMEKAEAAAAHAAPGMDKLMKGDKEPAIWLPLWWEFWRKYGATKAAKPLVDAFLTKRAEQRDLGARLWYQGSGAVRGGQKDEGYKVLEQLVREAPYSANAYNALRWLSQR